MKKIYLLAFFALAIFGFNSCEKDCTCVGTTKVIDTGDLPEEVAAMAIQTYETVVTGTETIEKGSCSDLDNVTDQLMMGIKLRVTVSCENK